jgi:hypothetical protein
MERTLKERKNMKENLLRKGHVSIWCLPLIAGVLLMLGCSGGGGGSGGTSESPSGSPVITLDRSSIDFGNQVVGQTADRSLTVTNTGNGDLVIGQINLAQTFPFFTFSENCSNRTLQTNGSCSVVVRFAPEQQGDFVASLGIPSNDGDRIVNVNVVGYGRGLRVRITDVYTNDHPFLIN